jgi:hypothetical protein
MKAQVMPLTEAERFVVAKVDTVLKLGEKPEPAFAMSQPIQMKLVPMRT